MIEYQEYYYKNNIVCVQYMDIINMCYKLPFYSVLIVLDSSESIKDILYKLKYNIIPKEINMISFIDNLGIIELKNGSIIRIVNSTPTFRGHRYNYCLANNKYNFDEYFVSNVLSRMVDYKEENNG